VSCVGKTTALMPQTIPQHLVNNSGFAPSLVFGQLKAGRAHTCGSRTAFPNYNTDEIICFGENNAGQLGFEEPGSPPFINNLQTDMMGGTQTIDRLQSLSAGGDNTCVIEGPSDQTRPALIKCWGDNRYGQLGPNLVSVASSTVPQTVATNQGNYRPINVAVGDRHVCALHRVWTGGAVDQLQIWCWGDNRFGQLGNGRSLLRKVPYEVRAPNR